jgi:hypothetical protein
MLPTSLGSRLREDPPEPASAEKWVWQSDFGQGAVFGQKRICAQTPEPTDAVNYYYNSPDALWAYLTYRSGTRLIIDSQAGAMPVVVEADPA